MPGDRSATEQKGVRRGLKLEGEYTFEAPRQLVWEALLDPNTIAQTIPGCDQLLETSQHHYEGPIRVGVGPVQGQFEASFTLSDLNPPESYHLKMAGNGPGGFMEGDGDIHLNESGESTGMRYAVDAQVGGPVASVGQRLLESAARVIVRQGLERLDRLIQERKQAG